MAALSPQQLKDIQDNLNLDGGATYLKNLVHQLDLNSDCGSCENTFDKDWTALANSVASLVEGCIVPSINARLSAACRAMCADNYVGLITTQLTDAKNRAQAGCIS